MIKQFLSGFIRIHILHHAAIEPIYGSDLIEELKRHGYKVGPGAIYPILHDLEKSGFLESDRINVEGRIRIYYRITSEGLAMLQECKQFLSELVGEVLSL